MTDLKVTLELSLLKYRFVGEKKPKIVVTCTSFIIHLFKNI